MDKLISLGNVWIAIDFFNPLFKLGKFPSK